MDELTLQTLEVIWSFIKLAGRILYAALFVYVMYHYFKLIKENKLLKKKLEFIKKHYDLEDAEFIFDSSEFEEDI